jgi:hypothetical protein
VHTKAFADNLNETVHFSQPVFRCSRNGDLFCIWELSSHSGFTAVATCFLENFLVIATMPSGFSLGVGADKDIVFLQVLHLYSVTAKFGTLCFCLTMESDGIQFSCFFPNY